MKLQRINVGDYYQYGPFTLRGIARRGDGRQGSRVNVWLVYRDGKLEDQEFYTLQAAVWSLQQRLAHAS